MQVIIGGAKVGLSKFGMNLYIGATLNFRHTMKSEPHFRLGIGRGLTIASNSGTLVAAAVFTDWFIYDAKKLPYLADLPALLGKTAEISVSGPVFGKGKVDIKMSIIDDKNNIVSVMNKAEIPTLDCCSIQVTSTNIRGKVYSMHDHNLKTTP